MWIRSLFIFGGYNDTSPASFVQEYTSYERCQTAYKVNAEEIRKNYRVGVVGTCTQK